MEPKIKSSKHGNSRLPDAFIQPRSFGQRDRKNTERINTDQQRPQKVAHQQNGNENMFKKDKKKRQSKNPFVPMRQWFKISKQFESKMNADKQFFEIQKFSKLSFDDTSQKQDRDQKIKYQDCITVTIMGKTKNSTLKKILHVPTLTVYFLRQSLINNSIDKTDLQQWINKCNSPSSYGQVRPQKIVQMYWNIPQSFYSIMYEYVDGVLFDQIIKSISILPLQFIQNLGLTHIKAGIQIYNSVLMIKRNETSEICYLPVYEQVDDITPQYSTFKQIMKINDDEDENKVQKLQSKLVARLGFLLMISFFSDVIVNEDIQNVYCQTDGCCFFHKQMSDANSLIKIFFQGELLSKIQKQYLQFIFCNTLKFKPEERISFSQLIKHKFFKSKFNRQICSIHEVISMLESSGTTTMSSKSHSKQLSLNKMYKMIDSMSVILQGTTQIQKSTIQLNQQNQTIRYLLQQFGLGSKQDQLKPYYGDIIGKLKRVYDV